ncbi:transcription factor PAP1-domain-containing protein [Podospora appendiculata]|uniref:Transcription factor PAP1-domain-containing protein n=1 Tax=Podospora appendiculata TaxID=314037 RepID=A0AAE1CFR7_9PEZI|nr:transcription factor PAP1-domain-containing protein [Podospora appendiculata]
MTSTQNPLHTFVLTPQQQNLLFAALNSNKPKGASTGSALNMSPASFDGSPVQGTDNQGSFQASPDQDFDYDFGGPDASFDFSYDNADQPRMIGDLPGTTRSSSKSDSPDFDSPDKRSHPDDDDDDENGGAKRREGEDKVAKKPGRKPLTTEPTSKRKAQNRAAQRAFRERKERHVKDLETKVEELEKVSEAANHENGLLRAKVDKMTMELNEYKKRVSLIANSRQAPRQIPPWGSQFINNINDVNFQFEFPKFGNLPGPPATNKKSSSASAASEVLKRNNSGQISPLDKTIETNGRNSTSNYSQAGLDHQVNDDLSNLSTNLFTSPLTNGDGSSGSSISLDSHFNAGNATSTSSPSASSNSNMGGPSSSCGTSPEPFTQSPMGFKPVDTLTTIGEEHPSLNSSSQDFGHFANVDVNDFSWLPQNDFQFDPHLFGGYREPQENILTNGLDDSFFNDAFEMDFTTPYNVPVASPVVPKKDLISQIDDAKSADSLGDGGQLLTCNKIWEKLQDCPKVQSGDFDLDGLCSDLQKKAKCSGTSAVVNEKDFKVIMSKYLDADELVECSEQLRSKNA